MPSICAIHQPNFFPWLGYFDKIRQADIFVFLDDVQHPKTGASSWVNRVKLNCSGKEKWGTCPIKRPPGLIAINQVEFADSHWRETFCGILKNYYRTSPNFKPTFDLLSSLLYQKEYTYLADFNRDIIENLSAILGHKTTFILKSSLNVSTSSTQMLIDVCKAVGATTYLCGGGASGYQEDEAFEKAGITLQYQNFVPTPYGSIDKFIPGLSVIDFLMNQS